MAGNGLNGNTIKVLGGIVIACIGMVGTGYAAHADMVGEVAALKEKVSTTQAELREIRQEVTKQAEKTREAIWELADRVATLTTKVAVESASHGNHRRSRR